MSDFKCPMCTDCPDNCPLDVQDINTGRCVAEWNMGYQQGKTDERTKVLNEVLEMISGTFENDTMKVMNLKRWIEGEIKP